MIKIVNKSRFLLSGALALGLAAQAAIASATVNCRAIWPAQFTDCRSGVDRAAGSGSNGAGGVRNLFVNMLAGTVRAQAAALDSNGVLIAANCTATDTNISSLITGSASCTTANAPSFLFVTVD
jgi:hypothetical protein